MGKMFFSVFFKPKNTCFFSVFCQPVFFSAAGAFFFRGGRFILICVENPIFDVVKKMEIHTKINTQD